MYSSPDPLFPYYSRMLHDLVLTAANAAQARGYAAQLRSRAASGALPKETKWHVIADPGGKRVGSGASTLWALHQLATSIRGARGPSENPFRGRRILVIHSGGDSRRLVAYAGQGKVFTPLPCSTPAGAPATLFDLILANLLKLRWNEAGGVLLAAGDVLLTFDPAEVDLQLPGVVGVAYPGPIDRARGHGVYVAGAEGRVTDFLQKPDLETAQQRGAVDAAGRLLIDTGLIHLDPEAALRWFTAARGGLLRDIARGSVRGLDLYEQLLMALPARFDRARYLAAVLRRPEDRARLTRLHRALHGQPFRVNVLSYCDFFHAGTNREMLANVSTLGRTAKEYGFANLDRAVVARRASIEGSFVFNSVLTSARIRVGRGCLIEASHTEQPVQLVGRNMLVGLPPAYRGAVRLPEGWGLVCLPVRGGSWSVVAFGVDDDFKTPIDAGGTLGNRPLRELLRRANLSEREVFTGQGRTLWDAKLWRVGPLSAVVRDTRWLIDSGRPPQHWRRGQRMDMARLLTLIDHDRLIAHRALLQRLADLHRLGERLTADPWLPARHLLDALHAPAQAALAMTQIDLCLRRESRALAQARLWRLSAGIAQRFPRTAGRLGAAARASEALAAVRRSIEQAVPDPPAPCRAAILPDQVVWATTPVRIDFQGGWSDTPPICTELGGSVVNAAITLNGQYPVQVMAKLLEEPVIRLNSIDLGSSLTLRSTAEVLDHHDPRHWSALPKAALLLSGVSPHREGLSLRQALERLGGGLDVTLFSSLPKGSGMGTSSILGAAVLACLARVLGENLCTDRLIARTSLLEQRMTTGGGWQDQVGGVTPGIKLIRTLPGADQTPSLNWAVFDRAPGSPFRECQLLYFTGIKRMARDILHKVVARYLERDPEAIEVIHRLKDGALRTKAALDGRNYEDFAACVEEYWTLKKRLDPGSTNDTIEALLRPLRGLLLGKVLPGAGGGGFVYMLARDERAARRVRDLLTRHPPTPQARFFDFDVDAKGLHVTVL